MGKKKLRSLRNGEEESTPDRRGMEKEEDTGAESSSAGGKTAEVQGIVLADGPQCCPLLL